MNELARAFCWGIGIFLAAVCIWGAVSTALMIVNIEEKPFYYDKNEDSDYERPAGKDQC